MDGSFVVKGNIIWSESLSSIKSMEDSFLVVEEGKVKGVFKTLPSQYSSLSMTVEMVLLFQASLISMSTLHSLVSVAPIWIWSLCLG